MRATLALLAPLLVAPAFANEKAFQTLTLNEVAFTEQAPDLGRAFGGWQLQGWPQPYVTCEGAIEAYLGVPFRTPWQDPDVALGNFELSLQAKPGSEVTGVLYLPAEVGGEMTRHPFRVSMVSASDASEGAFLKNRYLFYMWRYKHDLPGAAWFRHQARATRHRLEALDVEPPPFDPDGTLRGRRGRTHEVQDTYDLFTGGRALSENLALDEVVEPVGSDSAKIAITDIQGIETREIDWAPLVKGLDPELDPLAAFVPHDQYGVFFPSFPSLVRCIDEARGSGTPILQLFDASSEDVRMQDRYERQLCMPLDAFARMLGDRLVQSVAMTGGDPYLRTGSDVAVMFRATNGAALESAILTRQNLAVIDHQARELEGNIKGVSWTGVATADRVISSYVLRIDDTVVVSNSLVQLERVLDVATGAEPALASLDEYTFFRDRYRRGHADEDAFLVVSDAAIRRWCGPRWRIGASRRTRAAALLAEQMADDLATTLDGHPPVPEAITANMPVPGGGMLYRTDDGLRSEIYGTTRFQTPITELEIDQVDLAERAAYDSFRTRYERRWRDVFDPIAARLTVRGDRLELDLSVIPLVVRSDYRELVELTRDAKLPPFAGDLHDGTLLHFGMAFSPESRMFREAGSFAGQMLPGLTNPLSWMGPDVSLYLENDEAFWQEVAEADDPRDFIEDNVYRLPIAARLSSTDPLRLAAFLTGLRSMVQGSAPGLVSFETRENEGRSYVAIVPQDASFLTGGQPLVLYYATMSDSWVLSLREDVVLSAIDRQRARAKGVQGDSRPEPWLGESAGLRIGPGFRSFLDAAIGDEWGQERRRMAWRALPILNEWRRLAPDTDPLAFHARHWGVDLVCPGGGSFEWDAEWQTYASSVYGHPGAPREGERLPAVLGTIDGAHFGMTFEQNGLRARARLER